VQEEDVTERERPGLRSLVRNLDKLADTLAMVIAIQTDDPFALQQSLGELVSAALEDSARSTFRDVHVVSSIDAIDGDPDIVIEVVEFNVIDNDDERIEAMCDDWLRKQTSTTAVDDVMSDLCMQDNYGSTMEVKIENSLKKVDTSMSVILGVRVTKHTGLTEDHVVIGTADCSHGITSSPQLVIGKLMTIQAAEAAKVASNRVLDRVIPAGEKRPIMDIASSVIKLAKNDSAIAAGRELYADYCAECHGDDAKGKMGIPNLTDNDRLVMKSGSPEEIYNVILNGAQSVCFGLEGEFTSDQIDRLAEYALAVGNQSREWSEEPDDELPEKDLCFACHGLD
jgi:mono/diheme cytochrome c family protein